MSRVQRGSPTSRQDERRYRRIVGARLGLLYSVTLLALAFSLTRAGHDGPSLVVQLLTAPFGLLMPEVAITGMIVLWTLIGVGVAMAQNARARYAVIGTLAIHYAAAAFGAIAAAGTNVPAAIPPAPLLVLASLVLYLAGQVAIWFWLARAFRPPSPVRR
ncbi:MAG: hypothetical protein KF708_08035 [Pirellulales bacterium]|nr:hypothetical protein [Pirellulales bacterium]